MLGFEVDDLPADHAIDGAGGVGDFSDDGNPRLRPRTTSCESTS